MRDGAYLQVKDLAVSFRVEGGTIEAVRGVSFDVERGETVALVGESGSGKSVSALSVLQLLPYPKASHPSGSILVGGAEMIGADTATLREVRGNGISMIFQEPMTSLNPLHSIERQVTEGLFVHRGLSRTAAKSRALELLHLVGLKEAKSRLDSLPHQLSGGQRQRVMIAMALANEPEMLIADEPTTALDVTIQAQILELLKGLQSRLGMAMLWITHDLGVVRKIADRVLVMQAGEIVERGATAEVFANPQHAYTRHLIEAEPKGRPLAAAPDAPTVMASDGLKVYFPIKATVGVIFRKTVSHVRAVDDVALTVREGQTVGVVGESGSGKTTLGLALLRLTKSKGPITFAGRAIQGLGFEALRPLRREMQIVFQDPFASLSPRLSVGQIVEEGMRVHNLGGDFDERRALVSAALEEVGIEPEVAGPLPARVLGWPTPAHRHRPGHGAEAAFRGAGRAHLGTRHVSAGADHRPSARPASAPPPRLSVHQPRSQGGACSRRHGHRHPRWAHRRAGRCRADLRAAQDRLHQGTDRRRLRHRDRRKRRRADIGAPYYA